MIHIFVLVFYFTILFSLYAKKKRISRFFFFFNNFFFQESKKKIEKNAFFLRIGKKD